MSLSIVACGDIALCKGVERMILGGNPDQLAKDFRARLKRADLLVANIECPLTDSETPHWDYFPTLKANRNCGRVLRDLGVDVASLANNHIADYGTKGLRDTISLLEELNIGWLGAGWSPEEASRPLIIEKANHRVGILALAQPQISAPKKGWWGAGVLEHHSAITKMEELSKDVDVALAYLHFGVEFSEYPTPHQVRLSRSLIDAGATMVLGHHSHVPQGYEYYKDGFIAYSLGNFIFDMPGGSHKFSRLGLLVQADIENGYLANVEIVPVETREGCPKLLDEEDRSEAEEYLRRLSVVLKKVDDSALQRQFYFTCRDNLYMHVRALIGYGILGKNLRWIVDWFLKQFRPHIFPLRIDLIRFLVSGHAFEFERTKGHAPKLSTIFVWRKLCTLFWMIRLGYVTIFRARPKVAK